MVLWRTRRWPLAVQTRASQSSYLRRRTSIVDRWSVSHYGVLYRGTRPAPVFVEIRKNFYALDFPIDFYVPKEEFENSGSQPMSILFSRFNYSMRLFSPHVELKTLYNGWSHYYIKIMYQNCKAFSDRLSRSFSSRRSCYALSAGLPTRTLNQGSLIQLNFPLGFSWRFLIDVKTWWL